MPKNLASRQKIRVELSRTRRRESAWTRHDPKATTHPHFKPPKRPNLAPQRAALPWGFLPLRRFQTKAATHTGSTAPGYAAPPGFLNLLTLYSALVLLALFHARSAPGVEAPRGFPLPVAATAFTARCPSSHMRAPSRNEASAPLRRTTRRHRPRERRLSAAPKNDTSTSLRTATPPRSEEHDDRTALDFPRSSGIHAPGRSVHGEVVLPNFRRPILSQPLESPSRNSPFKPRLCKMQGLLSWACSHRWTNPTM